MDHITSTDNGSTSWQEDTESLQIALRSVLLCQPAPFISSHSTSFTNLVAKLCRTFMCVSDDVLMSEKRKSEEMTELKAVESQNVEAFHLGQRQAQLEIGKRGHLFYDYQISNSTNRFIFEVNFQKMGLIYQRNLELSFYVGKQKVTVSEDTLLNCIVKVKLQTTPVQVSSILTIVEQAKPEQNDRGATLSESTMSFQANLKAQFQFHDNNDEFDDEEGTEDALDNLKIGGTVFTQFEMKTWLCNTAIHGDSQTKKVRITPDGGRFKIPYFAKDRKNIGCVLSFDL